MCCTSLGELEDVHPFKGIAWHFRYTKLLATELQYWKNVVVFALSKQGLKKLPKLRAVAR